MYQKVDHYLYESDMRVLIDIIIRDMEMNRSEGNQFFLMILFQSLVIKKWWKEMNHRVDDLKFLIQEL